ncbi:MAG: Ca2+-dependent phosphoinositide-specific phospholipase C [Myxococcota bacterium]
MWLLACAAPAEDSGRTYPLDDVLRVNHVQVEGTHNSYHVAATDEGDLAYTHAPLDVQLDEQGVRQFEIDVQYDPDAGELLVYHIPVVDMGTTCETLAACLAVLRGWSDEHPDHPPLFVLIEPKTPHSADLEQGMFTLLEEEVRAAWPDRVLTPDDLRGEHPDLATAIAADGWPTLGATRGHLLLSLLDRGGWRDAWTYGGTTLEGRVMFGNVEPGSPLAAFILLDDPATDPIAETVDAGVIVRTRADTDLAYDAARFELAVASGAHALSTDVPVELEIPDLCNPRTAPPECTSDAVERR